MPRKPKITPRQVKAIAKRLAQNVTVLEIARAVKVSRTTVERVRADYNAITLRTALRRLTPGDYLADYEYKEAERRARGVSEAWRAAILQGIADSITRKDLIEPLPDDPRVVYAPQKIDPEHDPAILLRKMHGKLP